MRIVVLDMQSALTARGYERILLQDMADCHPIVSESPDVTTEQCRLFHPQTLLMEVTGYTPWMLDERLKICAEVRRTVPECKFVLAVDENAAPALAERVAKCKKDGVIDAFIFTSSSDRFLVAMIESL